jgi:hypothetical protein
MREKFKENSQNNFDKNWFLERTYSKKDRKYLAQILTISFDNKNSDNLDSKVYRRMIPFVVLSSFPLREFRNNHFNIISHLP